MESKEIKKFEITEQELNVIIQYLGSQPLSEALHPYAVLQGVIKRSTPVDEPEPNRATRRKLEKAK